MQLDVHGNLIGGPQAGEKASEYFRKQMRESRILVGFDCDDDGLGNAVAKGGRQSFLFGNAVKFYRSPAAIRPGKHLRNPSTKGRRNKFSAVTLL